MPMRSSAPKNIPLIISQLPPLRLRYTDAISAVRSAKERVMPQHDPHGFGLLWVGQSIQGHDVALKGEVASSLIVLMEAFTMCSFFAFTSHRLTFLFNKALAAAL